MGAIERFLERFGYAKLDRYGLVKTPEGRILSTRPAVLNDGLNGKVVGWTEDDLAAMELEHWGEAPRAPAKTVGGKKIVSSRPRSASSPPPLPGVAPAEAVIAAPPAPVSVAQAPAPVTPVTAKAAPVVIPAASAVIVPTPAVEEQPPVEEDEWEWEIAMARARAAAEDTQQAAAGMSFTKPAPKKAETLPAWPKTEEIDHFRDEWTDVSEPKPRVMSPLEKKLAVARTTPSGGTKVPPRLPEPTPGPLPQVHKTVIPVPSLPTARPADLKPAFSTAQPPRQAPQPPRRVARGSASLEDTVQTLAAPPAPANDATSPYVTLPPEVKPVGYAHTKRVAAKQR